MKEINRRALIKAIPSIIAGGVGGVVAKETTETNETNEHRFQMEKRWGETEAKVIGLEWRVDGIAQAVRNHERELRKNKK